MSPGARSSPLVAALAENEDIEVTIHYDERGMSFAALGHAMASGLPSACITTSGSAVANLLPACVEASHSGLPVIFITADRPPELRGTGANQTILQPGIFGTFVRLSSELPCPENDIASKESLVESIYEAVALATGRTLAPSTSICRFVNLFLKMKTQDQQTRLFFRNFINPKSRLHRYPAAHFFCRLWCRRHWQAIRVRASQCS